MGFIGSVMCYILDSIATIFSLVVDYMITMAAALPSYQPNLAQYQQGTSSLIATINLVFPLYESLAIMSAILLFRFYRWEIKEFLEAWELIPFN